LQSNKKKEYCIVLVDNENLLHLDGRLSANRQNNLGVIIHQSQLSLSCFRDR